MRDAQIDSMKSGNDSFIVAMRTNKWNVVWEATNNAKERLMFVRRGLYEALDYSCMRIWQKWDGKRAWMCEFYSTLGHPLGMLKEKRETGEYCRTRLHFFRRRRSTQHNKRLKRFRILVSFDKQSHFG